MRITNSGQLEGISRVDDVHVSEELSIVRVLLHESMLEGGLDFCRSLLEYGP